MRRSGSGIPKLLIAYDGSGYAYGALRELRSRGLAQKAQVIIISVCEIFLLLIDPAVVGERGLSSDQSLGLGSTSQKVLSESKCTVRIARPKRQVVYSQPRIIVGSDGSLGSIAAVKMVASRAWKTKPEIRLVIVNDPFTLWKPGRALDPIPGMSEGTMAGEEKFVEMLAVSALPLLCDSGLSATAHSYSGNPRMVLTREAQIWDADAVFVGATSSTSLLRMY